MKTRLITLGMLFVCFISAFSQANYIESYDYVSDGYCDTIQNVNIIRNISGGTILMPVFDDSCPEEMKGPFSYACKLVEEYLPPCLPLKIQVSCGRVSGGTSGALSRVLSLSKENFGISDYQNNPMSAIKGVILGELCYNSTISFLDSVPDFAFLTEDPDIKIVYNTQRLEDFSFTIDTVIGEKFDFVSVAMRDILRGLGISSSYRINSQSDGLNMPSQELTPFETVVNTSLGTVSSPTERLYNATRGYLSLMSGSNRPTLQLYAPETWVNGVSLNYFIPNSDNCISNVLSYDFCRGMVTRSLNDGWSDHVFTDILGWKYSFTVGNTPSVENSGSTALLVPYNGTLDLNTSDYILSATTEPCVLGTSSRSLYSYIDGEDEELYNYIQSFHPFLRPEGATSNEGVSISILKKDGSWDLVKFIGVYIENYPLNMAEWTFNYPDEDYARTVDGYLKARVTTSQRNGMSIHYYSKYFVVDYIPQTIKLNYVVPETTYSTRAVSGMNVRLYMKDLEGINRVVLERLREGTRLPTKTTLHDFKKGYYDTTIDRNTTFTVVGYNDNGYARSLPVSIVYSTASSGLSLDYSDGVVNFVSEEGGEMSIEYTIVNIGNPNGSTLSSGVTDGNVDISALPSGIYVVKALDLNSGKSYSFKVRK